jgi:predicted type IV restriction endonuclease
VGCIVFAKAKRYAAGRFLPQGGIGICMTQLPPIVANLIERFKYNRDSYKSHSYNETQLRREFLDPFLEALGWDVANRQGHAEAYKDVIHEDAIKIGGNTKAPDYCFRIGGARKFFLEAKKPAVNLKDEISPAYQNLQGVPYCLSFWWL